MAGPLDNIGGGAATPLKKKKKKERPFSEQFTPGVADDILLNAISDKANNFLGNKNPAPQIDLSRGVDQPALKNTFPGGGAVSGDSVSNTPNPPEGLGELVNKRNKVTDLTSRFDTPVFLRRDANGQANYSDIGPDGNRRGPAGSSNASSGGLSPGALLQDVKKSLGVSEYLFNTDAGAREKVQKLAKIAFLVNLKNQGALQQAREQGARSRSGSGSGASAGVPVAFNPLKADQFAGEGLTPEQARIGTAQRQFAGTGQVFPQLSSRIFQDQNTRDGAVQTLISSANPNTPQFLADTFGSLGLNDTGRAEELLTAAKGSQDPLGETSRLLNVTSDGAGNFYFGGGDTGLDKNKISIDKNTSPEQLEFFKLVAQRTAARRRALEKRKRQVKQQQTK